MNPSIGSSDVDSLSQTDSLEEETRTGSGSQTRISLGGCHTGSGISLDRIQTGSGISLDRIQTGSGISLDRIQTGSGFSLDGIQTGSGISLDHIQTGSGTELDNIQTGTGTSLRRSKFGSRNSHNCVKKNSGISLDGIQTGCGISLDGMKRINAQDVEEVTGNMCISMDGILTNSGRHTQMSLDGFSESNPCSSEDDTQLNCVSTGMSRIPVTQGLHGNVMHHSLERVKKGSRKQARFSFDNGQVFHTTSVIDLDKNKSNHADNEQQPLRRSKSVTGTDYSESRCRGQNRKSTTRMPRRHTVAVNDIGRNRSDSLSRSPPTCSGATPKENITSRRRRELAHSAHMRHNCEHHHHEEDSGDEYLTPSQRKDKIIRALKEEIRRLNSLLRDKEQLIQSLEGQKNEAVETAVGDKDREIVRLTMELEALRRSFSSLTTSHTEAVKSVESLEETVRDLKEEITKRDDEQQDLLLRMFKKGQQTAMFERQEDLENLARDDPFNVTVDELLDKLHNTESKLEWWQTIRTDESYQKGAPKVPQTEAEVRLHFLRDALFHYVTDRRDAAQHLKAMLGIMDFTESQKNKIDQVMTERKRFSKTAASINATIKKKLGSFKQSSSS